MIEPGEGITFLLLLLASAVVSGSEVALFSLDATAQEELQGKDDRSSRVVLALLTKPRKLLITILTLNTVINVSAAVLAAVMTARVAESRDWSPTVAFTVEVIALAFVLLVVSEITPKLVASRQPAKYSRRVAVPLRLLQWLLNPFVAIVARWMQRTQTGFTRKFMQHDVLSSDDVKMMAEIGRAHGSIDDDEHEWIRSIMDLGETPVRAVMISRLDITALPITSTLGEALALIRSAGHSRLPLYVDHLDNILGIIYAKDLLPMLPLREKHHQRPDWRRMMRPPMFVPAGKKLDDLLQDFQRKKTHIAIVVDEYGGTAGLVTLDDVLEEVVGDFRDEHDEDEEPEIRKLGEDCYRVDASMNLDDLSELLRINIDTEHFDFETLGGLILHLGGEIPAIGDTAEFECMQFLVEAVKNNRIRQVRINVVPPSAK